MDQIPHPTQDDPSYLGLRDAYRHLVFTLCATLPRGTMKTAQERVDRNRAAIAQIAGLCPVNAAEAALAAQFVAANAEAMDSLRVANDRDFPLHLSLRRSANAASMMRQSQGALRTLERLQAARHKRQTDDAAATTDAFAEHCALQLMLDALSDMPAEEPFTPVQLVSETPPEPVALPDDSADPAPDPLADAESYARIYPKRASLIRRLGRMPDDTSFGPPDPALVKALVTGQTPTLLALDHSGPEPGSPPLVLVRPPRPSGAPSADALVQKASRLPQ